MVVTPEEILDVLNKAIQMIDDIISELNTLEDKMKGFEVKRNVTKTVGSAINVVGGGLAVTSAFFTGGLSLLAASAISTAVGTSTNLVTDFIDRKKTKKCIKQIAKYSSEFKKMMEKLQALIKKFNEQIEEMMTVNDIDFVTAFKMFLGMPSFKSAVLYGCMNKIAEVIVAKRRDLLIGATMVNICSWLSAVDTKVLSNLFCITIDTAKAGVVIGKAGAAIGKACVKGVVMIGVIFTALDVVDLIRTLVNDHQTLRTIRDAKHSLKKTKSDIQENKNNLEEAQENARRIFNDAVKTILDEEIGGGYQLEGALVKQLNYDNFIEEIGQGTMGGFFEIFYLGLMIERTIELIDGTELQNISMLHGNSKLTFPCFRSPSDTIQLKMTSSEGKNHFNLLRNGLTIEITPHSSYENRCLYDAIAAALNITTDDLLERFKNFLRNNRAAREAYENGIAEILEELRGGRKLTPTGKELEIEKSEQDDITTYVTSVRHEHLNEGTGVSYIVRKWIQDVCKASSSIYDSGHIFAYKLGGRGDIIDYVVPMHLSLNRGYYKILETIIKETLQDNPSWQANLSVIVRYPVNEKIPYEFTYKCEFYDANNVKQVGGFEETFKNAKNK